MKPTIKKRKKNYVNNGDLLVSLSEYSAAYVKAKKAGEQLPQFPRYAYECIHLMATNYAKKPNFSGYSYVDEMIFDAIENCLRYAHNFDPTKTTNTFAYLTQFIHNAFIRRIKKENLQQYVKLKNIEYMFSVNEIENSFGDQKQLYENNYEFIRTFEARMDKKKPKNTAPKGVALFFDDEPTEESNE